MAESFIIWDEQAIDNSAVTGNGQYHLLTSPIQTNSPERTSLQLNVEFIDIPEDDAIQNTFLLEVIIESVNASGKTAILAKQFEPYVKAFKGKKREIIIQPNLFISDPGTDIVETIGNDVDTRISKFQGKLPENYRVCLILTENGFGSSGAFQSGKITVFGERYNVA